MTLATPHGGGLVNRIVSASEAATLMGRTSGLPVIVLDPRELADLELIAVGAVSPIRGYMGSKDYHGVLERMRLSDGTVWPLPISLAVNDEVRKGLKVGKEAALHDGNGRVWGTIDISEIFQRDPLGEARSVYRTDNTSHPGVAYLLSRPSWLVAGDVQVLPLPEDLPFASHRRTPAQMRQLISERGWRTVAGFQTRNPIHRAHEHLTKLALEFTDGLVIHPLVGETKNDDVPAAVRFQAYETLIAHYYPSDRTILSAFPAAMRYAGPREAIFHALVRKNYGITHFIVGRDHAGVGKFYGPFDAQEMFDTFTPEELGVIPLKFDATFYCQACGNLASPRTCPHDSTRRLELSGTMVREVLGRGGTLPPEFTRPEIAEILRQHYRASGDKSPSPIHVSGAQQRDAIGAPGRRKRGFILWFTGMSGAGKSTLANALRPVLEGTWPVELLDGDDVRTHLSKGLGFSREDRDTNIRRIGYVARLLARNSVAVMTAAISPYADTREEMRRLANEDGADFIEVFAYAQLESLVAREVKGLYKKALAGEIEHFTGVSDPYEPPVKPEIVVYTDRESVSESVDKILSYLAGRSLLLPVHDQYERRA